MVQHDGDRTVPAGRASVTRPSPPRHASATTGRRLGRHVGRRTALVTVVLLVVGWAVWLGVDALRARTDLVEAAALVGRLQDEVLSGDRGAAGQTLTQLQARSAAARDTTHGPHWSLASRLPWVGAEVHAVQVVSEVVDGLAVKALPGLLDATALVDPSTLAPVGGRVDLAPLEAAAPAVLAADRELQQASTRLADLQGDDLWGAVARPVDDLTAKVDGVAATTATAARAVRLLPAMLGADGPRTYLLLVQNTAEPRATGGIPGAVILLRAQDGAVQVVEQRAGGPLIDLPSPVLPLTSAESALFGDDLAADMRDVTFTPDFPRSAQIARAIWSQQVGGDVDGVLSVDPQALGLVLGSTGPVPIEPGPVADAAGGALTSANAASVLLSTVYLALADPPAQDAFFARTAASVFAAVATGQGGAGSTVQALAEAARQGRLMVWSAHPEEQEDLAGTVLSGELLGRHGATPVVGLYVNDAHADKMGFYLRTEVAVDSTACRADGSQALTVTVRLTSTAPAGGEGLPPYVTGTDAELPAGDLRMNVLLYAPAGGRVEGVTVSTGEPGVTSQVHDGLAVAGRTVQISPGENVILRVDVTTGPNQTNPVEIRTTPLPDLVLPAKVPSACS
ncbi:MAG TPA: DUF4012 domain-containing protein [Actinotalea sp.]